MSAKKKTKKSQHRTSKRTAGSKSKKAAGNQSTARSKRIAKAKTPKKLTKKTTAQKGAASTRNARRRRRPAVSSEKEILREIQNEKRTAAALAAGRQSGDLQGLSRAEEADSESVEELVEEGNLFEAGAVAGVEEADNADEREVHTHEVPEDDVPDEYLDEGKVS